MGDLRDRPPPEFVPLILPGRPKRYAVLAVGPVLWLIAFLVVAVVVGHSNVIEAGLLIAVLSFVIAFALLGGVRWRGNRERRAERG